MKTIFILMLMATLPAVLANHASAQKNTKQLFAVIDIIVEDTAMLHHASIEFDMSKMDVNTDHPSYAELFSRPVNAKKTSITVPLSTVLNYGRIQFIYPYPKKYADRPINNYSNLFLFRSGDTVALHLSAKRKGAWFTGKDADKYNCSYRTGNVFSDLDSVKDPFNNAKAFKRAKKFNDYFNSQKLVYDSLFTVQSKILNEYKGKLRPEIYNLILLDCWGQYNKHVVDITLRGALLMEAHGAKEFKQEYMEEFDPAKDFFLKDYGHYQDTLFKDPALLVKSYQYVDFLAEMVKTYAIITNSTPEKDYYGALKFEDINKVIDTHYTTGVLKDKLKLVALINVNKTLEHDYVNYIAEAVNDSSNSQFKAALMGFQAANIAGMDAYAFELIDKDGKINRLTDFKGKVVLLDFWYTGCENCIGMAEVLKKLIPAYKSNPHIVFITVSADGIKHKDWWQKSLTEELYSSKDEINLLAAEAYQSPIIQHYFVSGYPTLIVISKDGKIISTSPPDPRINERLFEDFINKYL